MIIGYEAKRIYHNASGLGNYSRNLLRVLSQFHPEHQYYLYNPSEGKMSFGEYLPNVHEKRPPIKNKLYRNIWRQRLLSDRAARDKVEVFHGLSQELPQGLSKKGIPTVVTIHDLIFLRYPQLYKRIDRNIYERKMKSACRRADLIVAISEQTKKDLIQLLDIDPEKIKVVYQGVNPIYWEEFQQAELDEIRQRLGLPEKFALYVGTLEIRKGADKILNAQLETGIPVVYVGRDTKFWTQMHGLEKYDSIRDKIFTPDVPHDEDLAKLYRMATVFLYPSIFEGFGIPVLEALISKTPVITSERSSLPEVAGPSSILVDPENQRHLTESLEKIWQSEALQMEMAKTGFTFAENFSDERIARSWDRIYRELREGKY